MNDQYFGKQYGVSDVAEAVEKGRTIPVEKPETAAPEEQGKTNGGKSARLDANEAERLRARWTEIQARFVDEPKSSVSDADALVKEVMQQVIQKLNNEMSSLEGQWKDGSDVSTEDLRQALQHYRSFFNNLVI